MGSVFAVRICAIATYHTLADRTFLKSRLFLSLARTDLKSTKATTMNTSMLSQAL